MFLFNNYLHFPIFTTKSQTKKQLIQAVMLTQVILSAVEGWLGALDYCPASYESRLRLEFIRF